MLNKKGAAFLCAAPKGKELPIEFQRSLKNNFLSLSLKNNFLSLSFQTPEEMVTGAKTVVHAVEGAKPAAEAMVRYMERE